MITLDIQSASLEVLFTYRLVDVQTVFINKNFADKNINGSGANESLHRERSRDISGFNNDQEIKKGSVGIESANSET